MPKRVSSPAEIEQAVHAERRRRFSMRSRTGWNQALEAEVADLIVRLLRGENINTGLNPRIKAALAGEGKKGLLLTGNDPALKIHVGGREVAGDGIVWADGRQESAVDPYVYLASADQYRRDHGEYETPRLTVQELAEGVGIPADDKNMKRLRTVLYRLRGVRKLVRDDDDRWRAGAPADTPNAVHNGDFTMVNWYGTECTFALGVQSSAVAALWTEWEKTGLGLHQGTIREAIDEERDSFRMDTAFRNHLAFGSMIQRCGDGRYRLAPPCTEPPTPTPTGKE